MSPIFKQPSFPAAWIVLAAVAPFLALAGMAIANMAGVRMQSHGTSAAGAAVGLMFFAVVAAAAVVEFCALVVGVVALWKRPSSRTLVNYIVLIFAAVAIFGFMVAIEFPSPWLR